MLYFDKIKGFYRGSYLSLFYPIFLIVCFLQAYFGISGGFPASGYVMWPFRLFILLCGYQSFRKSRAKIPYFTVFISYSLFSIFFIFLYDFPVSLYFIDLSSFILPMFAAYIATRDNENIQLVYKTVFYSWLVCFVIGFYLYFIRPSWYQSALAFTYNNSWNLQTNYSYEDLAETFRFSSFLLDSYPISHFTMFLMPISVVGFLTAQKKRIYYFICILIVYFTSMLSMHRASILSCSLSIGVLFMYDFFHEKRSGKYIFLLAIMIIASVSYIVQTDIYEKILDRFNDMTISSAFDDSRISQNKNLYAIMKNIITGSGIGSGSSNARRIGLVGISDGNYMKILYEQGVIGIMLFAGIALCTLKRAIHYFKYYSIEFCIICSILIAMTGSDSLTMPFYIIPFWYAIGSVWNQSYLQKRIQENNYL